jgi:chain length determinant protein EpsF
MTPKQIFLIVFAHRYVAAAMFVIVAISGSVFTLLTPKSYIATTDLLVDSRVDPIAGAATLGSPNYLATQIAILQSDRVAIGVVKRLRIADTPAFVEQWKAATQGKLPLDNYFAALLRKGLLVEPLRESNVIRVTYEGSDPKFVAGVANAYAQAYLDLIVDLRVEPVRQYAEWFDDRLKSLRDNVQAAQAKLSAYQQKYGIVGIDQRADQETQRLDALMAQLVATQGDNIAISSRQKTSGGELSPDIQASPVIQGLKSALNSAETKMSELKVSLGPNHPMRVQLEGQIAELKQQLDSEMRRVSGGAVTAKTSAGLRESELLGAVAMQKHRVLALRQERDQISVLVQDVDAAKRIYDSVLQRSNQLNLEKQTDQANVSVLSPAVEPSQPARPNLAKYLMGTLMGALAMALAAAGGLEFIDRRVRVLEDIMIEDVPVLGVIERRGERYTVREQVALLTKFFTKRKQRKEIVAASRLAGLT